MTNSTNQPYFQADEAKTTKNRVKKPTSITWKAPDLAKKVFTKAWYFKMSLFFAVLVAVAWFVLKSEITVILFAVVFVALIIYTKKSPQDVTYSLSEDGLFINDQNYSLDNFSGFGMLSDGELYSVVLLPAKRLATSMVLNFEQADGEKIMDFLGAVMPMRQIEENLIDKIVRRLGL